MQEKLYIDYHNRTEERVGTFWVHSHKHLEIYTFIDFDEECDGLYFYFVDNTVYIPKIGDVLIFRSNVLHGSCKKAKAKYSRMRERIPVDILDFLEYTDPELFDFINSGKVLVSLTEEHRAKYLEIVEDILRIKKGGGKHKDTYLFSCLLKQLAILCDAAETTPPAFRSHNDALLLSILNTINSNYSSLSSVSDIAAELNYSPNYLSQYFKKRMNMGLHEFLIEKKLSVAAANLLSGMNVTKCGLECGFESTSHFIRTFKAFYGVTPKQFTLQKR
ncbi:MAG: helix-turn-helix transcriptional regulator [Clostridia bacterium]|nr:helix-turn-helix transcriptional regulator [Clostridia bacterium]